MCIIVSGIENRKVVLFNRNLARFPRGKLLLISVYELWHDANQAGEGRKIPAITSVERPYKLFIAARRRRRGHPRAELFRTRRGWWGAGGGNGGGGFSFAFQLSPVGKK